MAATSRLELRLEQESKARLQRAADLAQVPLSDFVRSAAEERAARVLVEYDAVTRVPAAFFDELMTSLDEPPVASDALRRAAKRAATILTPD